MSRRRLNWALLAAALIVLFPGVARARVILQYFETDWAEITRRLPEIVMAGYDALWLPPPQKGAEGVRDVGFSVFDRFDLGDVDQRGTVRTRYGTRDELLSMSHAVDQLDLRLLFDVVMNHNGNPALIENVGVDLPLVGLEGFPDTSPLDYHVLPARARTEPPGSWDVLRPDPLGGGTVVLAPLTLENPELLVSAAPMPAELEGRFPGFTHVVRAPRIIFDGDLGPFENQTYSLLGLFDFALAMDGVHDTLGIPLPSFVRQPNCPECYPDGEPIPETIVEYIMRWIVWLAQTTGAEGFRLDAVRHVPTVFFDVFNQVVQDEYDAARGFDDPDDRDGVDDAQLFGESFTGDIYGELDDYYRTGMQMLNFPLFFHLTALLSRGTAGGAHAAQARRWHRPRPRKRRQVEAV